MDEAGRIRQVGTPEEVYERPADSAVFRFLGMANFLPVTVENGACRVGAGGQALPCAPPHGATGARAVGFRPSDVLLARSGPGLAATVKRASFLGAQTDYLLDVDGLGLRVQVPTHLALERGLLFGEGERCAFAFRKLHWFGPEAFGEAR